MFYYDRIKERTNTTGTGTITLIGPVTGYRSFSLVGDGNRCCYVIENGNDFEIGIGTYTAPDQLSRDVILKSSNSDLAVNWSTGAKTVFLNLPARIHNGVMITPRTITDSLILDEYGSLIICNNTADITVTLPDSTEFPNFVYRVQKGLDNAAVVSVFGIASSPWYSDLFVQGDYVSVAPDGAGSWIIIDQLVHTHKAKMRRVAAQSLADGAGTACDFDTIDFDIGGLANLTTNVFTIKRTGKYLVSMAFGLDANITSGDEVWIAILKNGSLHQWQLMAAGAFNTSAATQVKEIMHLAASETIGTRLYQRTGFGTLNSSTDVSYMPRAEVCELR